MEYCVGVNDWLRCLKCEHICTSLCPLEGDNVVAELSRSLRAREAREARMARVARVERKEATY